MPIKRTTSRGRRDLSFSLIRDERPLTEHVHFAFPAQSDAAVRAFHAAAVAAGDADHGGPGERAVNHPGYYGAFVLDPDGPNVEVVNHDRRATGLLSEGSGLHVENSHGQPTLSTSRAV